MEAVEVTDFPIRDHKVILVIRRRRWTDVRTGKSFSIPISLDIACKGTRYSKEFGAFLKETYGDIPRDLPKRWAASATGTSSAMPIHGCCFPKT